MAFPDLIVEELVQNNKNQSMLLNEMIRRISMKIAEDVASLSQD